MKSVTCSGQTLLILLLSCVSGLQNSVLRPGLTGNSYPPAVEPPRLLTLQKDIYRWGGFGSRAYVCEWLLAEQIFYWLFEKVAGSVNATHGNSILTLPLNRYARRECSLRYLKVSEMRDHEAVSSRTIQISVLRT